MMRRRRTVPRWLLTRLGRAPERFDLAVACRQCGRWGWVNVFRLGQRRARCWCQWCGAVVVVPDRAALRPRQRLPAGPPDPAAALSEVLPAAMRDWLAATGQPVTLDQLDRSTIYRLYRSWDAQAAGAASGLPRFSAVVGAVQDVCYRTELAVDELAGSHPAAATGPDRAALRERAEHARRWLALRGGTLAWIRRPGGQLAEPDRRALAAAARQLRAGAEPPATQSRAVRAAVFGTEAGPPVRLLRQVYPTEQLLAALATYQDRGERPLREDVLAHLTAPVRSGLGARPAAAPAGRYPPVMGQVRPRVRIDRLDRTGRRDRRVTQAADVLAASLADGPGARLRFPDPARRYRYLRHLLGAAVRDLARYGRALVAVEEAGTARERVLGVLLAMPPQPVPIGLYRRLRMVPRLLLAARLAPRSVPRSLRSARVLQATLPPGSWWYVHTIGVHPAAQRCGIGSLLARHALGLVDATGLACYLHTDSPAAVAFYRGLGFEVDRAGIQVEPDGPPYTLMVRPPASAG